ncbi:CLUMA_CG018131, isoform A [Clunio marinus]|uniref:Tyrosine--tRNA ligase n=1 Tax=Clunio marinus TaxID=568069 RepID=A0A1J1J372_9DIPT|nr:CLUMA_CG018131, isoform A [Clunio marinus]
MLRLRKIINSVNFQHCRQVSNILKLRNNEYFQEVFPHESVSKIQSILGRSQQTLYAGFDPTSNSLHVGNLLILISLLHSQRGGHKPIALLGGATARIGDPSGRSSERVALDEEVIDYNLQHIRKQIQTVFDNHEKFFWNKRPNEQDSLPKPMILDNSEWYKNINFVEFISQIGRHFRMGQMLSRASVQSRLQGEQGMSFTEFTYQIFQAYDWVHLLKTYNCNFQIGGNDQMGNIMTGHELISRVSKSSEVFGLTLPLITNEEGDKFGKSQGKAVWLDANKTSEFAFYQFFVRLSDADAERFMKLLSLLPDNEMNDLLRNHKKLPDLREAQKSLAQDLTLLVHGEEGLEKALMISKALYSGNIQSLGELKPEEVPNLFTGASYVELYMEPGTTMLDAAMKVKCFPTEQDAYRIINAGGFYINQQKTKNPNEILSRDVHVLKNGVSLFRVGKKNYYVVRWM